MHLELPNKRIFLRQITSNVEPVVQSNKMPAVKHRSGLRRANRQLRNLLLSPSGCVKYFPHEIIR